MAKRSRGNVEATLRHTRASVKRDAAQNARLRSMQAQLDAVEESLSKLWLVVNPSLRKR